MGGNLTLEGISHAIVQEFKKPLNEITPFKQIGKIDSLINEAVNEYLYQSPSTARLAQNTIRALPLILLPPLASTLAGTLTATVVLIKPDLITAHSRTSILNALATGCLVKSAETITSGWIAPEGWIYGGINLALSIFLVTQASQSEIQSKNTTKKQKFIGPVQQDLE